MTKLFTMVKGEVDIVEDWVLYHGSIFGFSNLYIIDNFSHDGTWETLLSLAQKLPIHIMQQPHYKQKGQYMTHLLRTVCPPNEIGIPIDIDEFIVAFDKQTQQISCRPDIITQEINALPITSSIFKMNYIDCKVTETHGYTRAVREAKWGEYRDYGNEAKSFFRAGTFTGNIDHGNHYPTSNYTPTNLCLLHYHTRNIEQMMKKIYNNVVGLGYPPFHLTVLKHILATNPRCDGCHHVQHQIHVLEKKYQLPIVAPPSGTGKEPHRIRLSPIAQYLQALAQKKVY